jgi:hypothetical protein
MPKEKNALYKPTGETMEEAYLRTIVADFHFCPSEGSRLTARGFAMVWPEVASYTGEVQSENIRFAEYELMRACHTRRFDYGRRGRMGLVPEGARIGDLIAILLGGQVPTYFVAVATEKAVFASLGKLICMRMVDSGECAIGKIVLE